MCWLSICKYRFISRQGAESTSFLMSNVHMRQKQTADRSVQRKLHQNDQRGKGTRPTATGHGRSRALSGITARVNERTNEHGDSSTEGPQEKIFGTKQAAKTVYRAWKPAEKQQSEQNSAEIAAATCMSVATLATAARATEARQRSMICSFCAAHFCVLLTRGLD